MSAREEERIIYMAAIALGTPPVGIAIYSHATWGPLTTLGLLMASAGLIGLVRNLAQRDRVFPKARVLDE